MTCKKSQRALASAGIFKGGGGANFFLDPHGAGGKTPKKVFYPKRPPPSLKTISGSRGQAPPLPGPSRLFELLENNLSLGFGVEMDYTQTRTNNEILQVRRGWRVNFGLN